MLFENFTIFVSRSTFTACGIMITYTEDRVELILVPCNKHVTYSYCVGLILCQGVIYYVIWIIQPIGKIESQKDIEYYLPQSLKGEYYSTTDSKLILFFVSETH